MVSSSFDKSIILVTLKSSLNQNSPIFLSIVDFNKFSSKYRCALMVDGGLGRIALTTHTFSGYCSTTELQGLKSKNYSTFG